MFIDGRKDTLTKKLKPYCTARVTKARPAPDAQPSVKVGTPIAAAAVQRYRNTTVALAKSSREPQTHPGLRYVYEQYDAGHMADSEQLVSGNAMLFDNLAVRTRLQYEPSRRCCY
jgi:hypothetical protein